MFRDQTHGNFLRLSTPPGGVAEEHKHTGQFHPLGSPLLIIQNWVILDQDLIQPLLMSHSRAMFGKTLCLKIQVQMEYFKHS